MSIDNPIPRFTIPIPAESAMQSAMREWQQHQQRRVSEMAQYEWRGLSSYGPIIARVMPDGSGMVLLDTDHDGVFETQAVGKVNGSIAATPDFKGAPDNIRVTPGTGADEFARDVFDSLNDEIFDGADMDRLALRALQAAGRTAAGTSR